VAESQGSDTNRLTTVLIALALLAVLLLVGWVYWPIFEQVIRRWALDPQYTHGYVVPVFALVVLWYRRDSFPSERMAPTWWGIPVLLLGTVLRLTGSLLSFEWLEAGSVLPTLVGLILLTAGGAVAKWAWPAYALMLFVLPWPWQFDLLLTGPLRQVATTCSTFALQTLGVPALARGNIILVNDLEVGIVEACSGLGMLMTFFALSTAVAFLVDRPVVERWILFFSAIPIGILMNVARITTTVFLYQFASAETARLVFHDLAGWIMMPLALLVLWLEMLWLRNLWVPVEPDRPVPVNYPPCSGQQGNRQGSTSSDPSLPGHGVVTSRTWDLAVFLSWAVGCWQCLAVRINPSIEAPAELSQLEVRNATC